MKVNMDLGLDNTLEQTPQDNSKEHREDTGWKEIQIMGKMVQEEQVHEQQEKQENGKVNETQMAGKRGKGRNNNKWLFGGKPFL